MGWPQHKHGNMAGERRGGIQETIPISQSKVLLFAMNGVDKKYFLFVFVFMYIYFIPEQHQLSKIGSYLTQASSMINREHS